MNQKVPEMYKIQLKCNCLFSLVWNWEGIYLELINALYLPTPITWAVHRPSQSKRPYVFSDYVIQKIYYILLHHYCRVPLYVTHFQKILLYRSEDFTITNVIHDAERSSFGSFYELLQNTLRGHPTLCYTRCKSQSLPSSPCIFMRIVKSKGLNNVKGILLALTE